MRVAGSRSPENTGSPTVPKVFLRFSISASVYLVSLENRLPIIS